MGISKQTKRIRFRNNILLVLCLMSFLLYWHHQKNVQPVIDQNIEQVAKTDHEIFNGETFNIVYVVDGDTVDIDKYGEDGKPVRIRLLGVDTPENYNKIMYYGPEAEDFANEILLNKQVTVFLNSSGKTRDYWNRLLAYIQTTDGHLFNETLIEDGYGYADLRFKHDKLDEFTEVMDKAIEQKKGLWEKVTRKDMPKWLQKKRPELLKP